MFLTSVSRRAAGGGAWECDERESERDGGQRGTQLTCSMSVGRVFGRWVVLALLCMAALAGALAQGEGEGASAAPFCQEGMLREAYARSNHSAPFENKCTSAKYTQLEQQYRSLVKHREDTKLPLTDACADHVRNFLCLQCNSQEEPGTQPGSWSLCDSKCKGCKRLPLVIPQNSNMYKVCC